jgi:hypothetical protein
LARVNPAEEAAEIVSQIMKCHTHLPSKTRAPSRFGSYTIRQADARCTIAGGVEDALWSCRRRRDLCLDVVGYVRPHPHRTRPSGGRTSIEQLESSDNRLSLKRRQGRGTSQEPFGGRSEYWRPAATPTWSLRNIGLVLPTRRRISSLRLRRSSVATASYLGKAAHRLTTRMRIQFRIQLSPDSCRNMRSVVPSQKSKMPMN